MNRLRELYLNELRDLYGAERRLADAISEMNGVDGDQDLIREVEGHLRETERQLRRADESLSQREATESHRRLAPVRQGV